jgi:DNA helicase-2/ATP-dependent DNA helicase PcrA
MHEYYWENYTEMDQYGYENFDNQQALLMQVNANTDRQKMQHRLRKMLDSPFFGSVDFIYEGEEEPGQIYIGIANFSEKSGQVPLIYDWRAPASGLFYDYDRGQASYEAPGGRMDGEIVSKRQYKIRDGRMIYELESDTKIDDDILRQELSGNSDVQLKNIVRTIQKEQNAIIRNTSDRILVIQGAAGSGKTSIALHRIAYLLYHDRVNLNSSNVLILSPNGVFSDYISHILPELGEEHIQEMSFDLFAYQELKGIVADCEDRYHQIEREMREGETRSSRWKRSDAFVRAVEGFLVDLEDRLVDFHEVEYRGFVMTDAQLLDLFYFKFPDIPLLDRMQAVMDYYVDSCETLLGKNLGEETLEHLREQFMNMYVTQDICVIYNWLLQDCKMEPLPDVTPERRILDYEDVYPLLYLKYRLQGFQSRKQIRHLVIDEMQDYSYLQYVILRSMFDCSMTILGDRAQTIGTEDQDVLKFLPKIFGRQIRQIEIRKSYRNTTEIAEYAEKISGIKDIEYLERHGKAVTEETFDSWQQAMDAAAESVRVGKNAYETAAVLTMTEQEARSCYEYLSARMDGVSYIDRDSTSFRQGITVTTFYQAKGLEFDQVFLLCSDPDNSFFDRFRYIGATRALHELYVWSLGQEDAEKHISRL